VTVFCADCLDVLPTIDSVDVVLSDPPYEVEAHTLGRRVRRGGQVCVEPLPFASIDPETRLTVARAFGRIAKRWVCVFCQVEAAHAWRLCLEDGGLVYRRTCVWVKPDGQPQLTGDRPGMGYESIVVAHHKGRSKWNGGGKTGVFIHNKGEGNGPQPHPTTKPLRLMTELVSLFTDPGELILDPFAGSGTTGAAAKALGRRAILIEKDERHCETIVKRLAQESLFTAPAKKAEQAALFGGDE